MSGQQHLSSLLVYSVFTILLMRCTERALEGEFENKPAYMNITSRFFLFRITCDSNLNYMLLFVNNE